MLHAVRLPPIGYAHQPGNRKPIPGLATLLNDIPPARLFEESLKLLQRATVTKPISCCVNIISSSRCSRPLPATSRKMATPDDE
ncbi:hypothetical protein ACNKHW_00960 [Shigella flexneri]